MMTSKIAVRPPIIHNYFLKYKPILRHPQGIVVPSMPGTQEYCGVAPPINHELGLRLLVKMTISISSTPTIIEYLI